jgi:hypothetical protein
MEGPNVNVIEPQLRRTSGFPVTPEGRFGLAVEVGSSIMEMVGLGYLYAVSIE